MNLIKEYRPTGIAVTDLSAQLWCEKQLEFSLAKGKTETKEMSRGKDRHKELHEEIAKLVKVEPKTIVDRIALSLHNGQIGIKRLIIKGKTRELPTFGKINSLFVRGSVDELNLRNDSLFILDTKTRRKNTMPSEAQKRTTRFQLMLYHKLIHNLVSAKFSTAEMMDFYELKISDKITDDFKKQIDNIGHVIEPNIKKLTDTTFNLFQKLPHPKESMQIRYEYQQNRKLIGVDEFTFDSSKFQRDCDFVEEFWIGKRKAIPVGLSNAWKCNFCEFNDICEENPQLKN